jgi:hypothetical protein
MGQYKRTGSIVLQIFKYLLFVFPNLLVRLTESISAWSSLAPSDAVASCYCLGPSYACTYHNASLGASSALTVFLCMTRGSVRRRRSCSACLSAVLALCSTSTQFTNSLQVSLSNIELVGKLSIFFFCFFCFSCFASPLLRIH